MIDSLRVLSMPSFFQLGASTVLGLSLAGACAAALPGDPQALPHISTLSAFQTGVYHFYDQNNSLYKLGKKAGQSYRLSTQYSKGSPKYFSYGTTRDWTVRNGALQRPSSPNSARAVAGNRVNLTRQGNASGLSIELKAYDVSDQSIASYLKLQNGRATALSDKVSTWTKFASGSVAYVPTITSLRTELIVPEVNIFTGQKTVEGFVKAFSEKIPNCLRYEKRSGSQPYAIRFSNRKGNTGNIEIYRAKRGKVFCEVDGPKVANGSYKIQTINGTKVLALNFPQHIDRRDIGIHSSESGALDLAFIEVKKPHPQVLPGRILHANRPFTDNQYRFNKTAAESIQKALK